MKPLIAALIILTTLTACNRQMTRAEIEQRRLYTETGLRMMDIGSRQYCCHHQGYYR